MITGNRRDWPGWAGIGAQPERTIPRELPGITVIVRVLPDPASSPLLGTTQSATTRLLPLLGRSRASRGDDRLILPDHGVGFGGESNKIARTCCSKVGGLITLAGTGWGLGQNAGATLPLVAQLERARANASGNRLASFFCIGLFLPEYIDGRGDRAGLGRLGSVRGVLGFLGGGDHAIAVGVEFHPNPVLTYPDPMPAEGEQDEAGGDPQPSPSRDRADDALRYGGAWRGPGQHGTERAQVSTPTPEPAPLNVERPDAARMARLGTDDGAGREAVAARLAAWSAAFFSRISLNGFFLLSGLHIRRPR